METVYIEKVIKEFNSEGTIRTFIELALFTLEIFVEMGKCDNNSRAEFLTEASVRL